MFGIVKTLVGIAWPLALAFLALAELLLAGAVFIQHAKIMIGELQIIFGGHPVALGLRIARQILVLFEKLARIAPLARINPVPRVRTLALTAAATHRTLPAPTAPIIAAVLPIIDQNSISLFVDPANACCSRIRVRPTTAEPVHSSRGTIAHAGT